MVRSLLLTSLLLLVGPASPLPQPPPVKVGFFSPEHVDRFAARAHFSVLNLYLEGNPPGLNLRRLEANLRYIEPYPHRLHLNLDPLITRPKPPEALSLTYRDLSGRLRRKVFLPSRKNRLRAFVPFGEMARRLQGLPELISKYRDHIGILQIADEPYLNGISREELERTARWLRAFFASHGLEDLQLGVVFAGPMFHREAAREIHRNMVAYVERVDDHYLRNRALLEGEGPEAEAFRRWVAHMERHRLATYDRAGNVYLEGGIPEGVDVVAFDFYLSSLLFDQIHETTLSKLAELGVPACREFSGVRVSEIRARLSFFHDGPVVQEERAHASDRELLDRLFWCRMEGTLTLLLKELYRLPPERRPRLMAIGEASANGLLEFDRQGRIEPEQPDLLVERRMLDEVKRSFRFYERYRRLFEEGLLFFLYEDTYDETIDLLVRGAEGAPSVLTLIYRKAWREGVPLPEPFPD